MAENRVDRARSNQYSVNVEGGVSGGQFTVGHHNNVTSTQASNGTVVVAAADLAILREQFARVREQLPADGPLAEQAREHLDDLEDAVTASQPNVSTMHAVRDWFARKLPYLAAAVTGLIIHPVVDQLITASGAAVIAEFQRFFGDLGQG